MVKIIKILRVEDTRNWEEIEDDVWVPIPGTGIENNCGRCGRSHEVHATVEVEADGILGSMIVGTGCMHADEAEVAGKIRSILNAQRTLEKNKRLLAKKEALREQHDKIRAEVLKLSVPDHEIRMDESTVGRADEPYTGLYIGDAGVRVSVTHLNGWGYLQERIDCVTWLWRQKREDERGMTRDMRNVWQYVADLKKRIARSEKKIAEFGLQETVNA